MAIERILVPVDFSAGSLRALRYAVDLCALYVAASIDVLHVSHGGAASGNVPGEAEAAAFIDTIKSRGRVPIRRLDEQGEVASTIVSVARRERYDLIVMGTRGREGVIAREVVRDAPCPVLTVGAEARATRAA